jgi:hypothetical protein
MAEAAERLAAALSDRYRLDRELGQRGTACGLVAEATMEGLTRARVALRAPKGRSVTARRLSLKRRDAGIRGHFSDIGRAAASAASSRRSAETSTRS